MITILPSTASVSAVEEGRIHSLIPTVNMIYSGVEEYIADSLRGLETTIEVTGFGITTNNIMNVFKSSVFSNPDIFYVDSSYINYKYDKNTNIVRYISPSYLLSKSEIAAQKKKFNRAVNNMIGDIGEDWSDLTKALVLHDRLVAGCEYELKNDLSYTAYSALVTKKSVCEGYSRAYSYLLSKVGIDSRCLNNGSKAHCWNQVKLGDNWYHVDVTSDDPIPDTTGFVDHKYFLISDERLASYASDTHTGHEDDITADSEYACASTKYDSSFFRRVQSQTLYINGSYYYFNPNYQGKRYSAFIRRVNGTEKVLKLFKDIWYSASGKRYNNTYSKLCYKDGYIYFNSKRELYRLKLSNHKINRLFTMPSFWGNDFYGIKAGSKYIYAERKKALFTSASLTKILEITSDNKVIQLPFIRCGAARLKQRKVYTMKVYRGTGKTKYKSSNPRIARVSTGGRIRGLRKGVCTVTAVKNGITMKMKIRVV